MSLRDLLLRPSAGGWPDGVNPGFVELGADPRTSPGFAAPPGTIGKFGLFYLRKFGSTATAWELLRTPALGGKQVQANSLYHPGQELVSNPALGFTGAFAANILYTLPFQFANACRITILTTGAAFGTTRWCALYRESSSNPLYPGERAAAGLTAGAGGGEGISFVTLSGGGVVVSPGEWIHFALVVSGASTLFNTEAAATTLGSSLTYRDDGSGTAFVPQVGWAPVFAFAEPPATYPVGARHWCRSGTAGGFSLATLCMYFFQVEI